MTSLKGKKILLVDDEAAIRELLKDEFLLLGATVEEAGGGRVALEMVKAGDYDAVITDAKMPEGDGLELAVAICRLERRQPKIFLCSGLSPCDIENTAASCIDTIFEKPLDFEKITSVVAASLVELAS